ncbi:glycosyltransferase family 4 protein [Sporolactobacillus nakayamae]|uniref:Glycosyltransferase involved in cell wall bisynthesis n=1 Tax=Sporolactobacillus nakayamae TaxID=269670 RepID=A0A1I2R0I9_9BACL|nr:glycosyltransferase family 4 protein [Sporolactobacillus nakayamae]SFG31386.1 Glycosyltransferase involved in cell wall bisynthesis [Sporolactobacillus nakayamae]
MSEQVAYVSTYLPQKCGIATYTYHLRQNVQKAKRDSLADPVVIIKDKDTLYPEDPFSSWAIERENRSDYTRIAEQLNRSAVLAVSLQHEFGIFGGNAGEYILDFVRTLKKPLVTTFHTVFKHPEEPYASIQRELVARSDRIVVMNHKAITYLKNAFQICEDKIAFIPHGTPVPDMKKRSDFRGKIGWTNRKVIMTFGFLSRNKGIEAVLCALPEVVKKVPNALYVIIGQTHPNVKKQEGESYRNELKALICQLHLEDHVQMIDEFMTEQDLVRYITACDLYITPYPGLDQITSGTLAYAIGLGRPVLTTPYRYAQDLLKGYEELFVSYEDKAGWVEKMNALLFNDTLRTDYQTKMAHVGLSMSWPQVGKKYNKLFAEAAMKLPSSGVDTIARIQD